MKNLNLLILLTLFLSCNSGNKNQYFESVANNDVQMSKPIAGEWLFQNKEKGQSFDDYIKSNVVGPTKENNIIYIEPIGKFTSLQNKQIKLAREYLEIFFQLKTRTLDTISNAIIPSNARRIGNESNEQLLASYVLNSLLIKQKPKDAIALMGLSELDLFPKPEWNYVFGLASYKDKVGVSSIYRLQNGNLTNSNFNLCLSRVLKICSHEIGHMFGLKHCIFANCVMNGTNSLHETDKNPSRLCSNCQRKLNYSIKYNNEKRLKELIRYFERNNMTQELASLQADLDEIE